MEYLIGMDGGGTSTKICITDREGCVIANHRAGALNINGQSLEQFLKTMTDILNWLRAMEYKPEHCAGIGIGAAGSSNPMTKQLLTRAFEAGGYRAPLYVFSDGETALASVHPECHGIILISGTGSLCLGRRADGTTIRTGGYGHLIDDGGSAYAMAIAMLSAVVRAEDGRGEPTVLRHMVMEKLKLDKLEELVGYLYAPERSKKDIAALAVLVNRAAAAGDAVAMEIERISAVELILMVQTIMDRLPEEENIALAGKVLFNNRNIRNMVIQHIKDHREFPCIRIAHQDASEGAISLLLNEID